MVFNKLVVFSLICNYMSSEAEEPNSCRKKRERESNQIDKRYWTYIPVKLSKVLTLEQDRSNFFRQDGGLCFEIPPWQHQPVELELHIQRMRSKWGAADATFSRRQALRTGLSNGEITRYMDTVIAPFLDTYHRNIQNSYQQLTTKILRRIKEEVNSALKRKQQIYKDLIKLADELDIPPLCDEERRQVRTIASNHVAQMFSCTEDARASITEMGKYAEDMISLTKKHMQRTIGTEVKVFGSQRPVNSSRKAEIETCLENLSKAAVTLGYELDLSLTNARRHNEQSCERLTGCSVKARKRTDDAVADLRDLMHQCVYT